MSSPSEQGNAARHRATGRTLKWALGGLAAIIVFAAILVGLFRLAANILPRYHARIAQEVSAQLGMPVRIGRISLVWHGLGPALVARDVRILDASQKRTVLSARRLRLDFTLFAVMHGSNAHPSGIAVRGLQITATETANGALRIPGLTLPKGPAGAGNLADMLGLHADLGDATIRLALAGAPQRMWVFAPVNLDVGGGRKHALSLVVGLPDALGGGTLHAAGTLDTPSTDFAQWRWSGHYAFDRLLLQPLARFMPAGVPEVDGTLALDGQATGLGDSLNSAQGQLVATDLSAGASSVQRFETRYELNDDQGFTLLLRSPTFLEANGSWTPGEVTFGRDAAGRLHGSIENLPLDRLPPLVGFLPMNLASFGDRLSDMHPVGKVEGTRFAMTPGGTDLDFSCELQDVGVQAADQAPGFRHLSAAVTIRGGEGSANLDSPDFTLLMPHIFDHPVELDRISGRVGITLDANGLKLATPSLSILGPAGLDGALEGEMAIPGSGPITIRIAASGGPMAVDQARQDYLPTGLIPVKLDRWLLQGIDGGRVTGATLAVEGDVRKFPYANGGGRFTIDLGFDGVALKPGPDWEPLENLNGTVQFLNAGLNANVTSGNIGHARVVKATATIADIFKPRLKVHATVAGDASDFQAFLASSPVGKAFASRVTAMQVQGPTTSVIDLDLPVEHPAEFSVGGTMQFGGVTAHYAGVPYGLAGLAGTVRFDGQGPLSGKLKGTLLDTAVTLSLVRRSDAKALTVGLDGRFPVTMLSRTAHYDLGKFAAGSLPLNVELTVPLVQRGPPITVAVYSRLDGLAVTLPPPVGKQSAAEMLLAAQGTVNGDSLEFSAHYGDVLSACAALALNGVKTRLRAARLILGVHSCQPPASGVLISGGWPKLNLKPWIAELPRQGGGTPSVAGRFDLDLHFGELDAFGHVFKDESIRGSAGSGGTALEFDGPDLAGKVTAPAKPSNDNPIVAELSRARFVVRNPHPVVVAPASAGKATSAAVPAKSAMPTPATTTTAEPPAATATAASPARRAGSGSGLHPADIPPFKLHVGQAEIGNAVLHDVDISARQVPGGILIDPITVGGGALTLQGTLVWVAPADGEPQGALHFVGQVSELGKLLTGLGLGPVITGHGTLSAGLAWHTFSSEHFTDQLLGRISVDMRNGSISQVNPGAGRLLTLLNLANIPRYLVFNFNNLFGKGFPFSRIHGDYVIQHGIADTKGLYIDSSVADIKLTGSIDLGKETIDQKAEIMPNYTGSLPVIGALFGGLGVGAAVFALTKILGNPIAQLTKLEYSITGPFSNPLIKPLGHSPPPKAGTHPAPAAATAGGGR